MTDKIRLPELLAPAGSFRALEAAVEAGADAVYMGGSLFNARINAANFDDDEMKSALQLCRTFSVRSYITLNIQLHDRELKDALRYARFLFENGADALITADPGFASLVNRAIPDFELHASTQMSGHSAEAARFLKSHGFSRMVCARELSEADIKKLTSSSPIEIEAFIHGAHCVSHSGQCMASFAMGGRSGNRGECAQPCRLAYSVRGEKGYPLSLKDMCLAGSVKNLIDSGISSLKIEGRMKSPEYVYGVVKIYRRLLDQQRNASPEEIAELAALFSRGGFTDGYFKNQRGRSMLGIRSESDKEQSRKLEPFDGLKKRIPVKIKAEIKADKASSVSVSLLNGGKSFTAYGDVPEIAVNAPLSYENIKKQLSRLGGTYYSAADKDCEIDLGDNLIMPVSKLNALRRAAVSGLDKTGRKTDENLFDSAENQLGQNHKSGFSGKIIKSARFAYPEQITDAARDYFDIIYLPLENYKPDRGANGIIIPPAVFDSQSDSVREMLGRLDGTDVIYALVSNIGHIKFAEEYGLECRGDFRLNAFNSESMNFFLDSGFKSVIASPELTLRQTAGLNVPAGIIVYGKIPVMLLERCIMRGKTAGCHQKSDENYVCRTEITDRTSMKFPVTGTFGHRNIVYNTVPVYMADKMNELKGAAEEYHYIFSDESAGDIDRIIRSYKNALPANYRIRRIK